MKVLILLMALAGVARAERPWAAGVPQAQQDEALRIFKDGNTLFAEGQHARALARYRDALKVWDHPGIQYNAAVALMNLDQPLAAYEHLESALRYDDAPLGAETYKQALLYKKLLAGQLAELEVACDEPGAEVMLDGQLLFTGPGRQQRRLLPGTHSLVTRKAGMLPSTRALQLRAGFTRETVKLQTLASLPTRTVRRWAVWKPWTAFAAGLAVALVGVPLIVDAKKSFDSFDAEITRLCPAGCTPAQLPTTVVDAQDRGRAENGAAIGMFVTGGAIAAASVVLLILNQPRLETIKPAELTVVPLIGPAGGGLSASVRF
jgi:hypothetical protein